MIVARAPLRISFAGGGTDLPEFSRRHTGRVIASAIDKHVFIAVNHTAFIDKICVRYSRTETVDHPADLQHTRIRAALLDMGIGGNIEIGSFASLPSRSGLGSSSSFTVALLAALHAYRGHTIDRPSLAEAACRLEVELVGEPIGKQDQYAAAFGGVHVFEFHPDGTVQARPVVLPTPLRRKIEYHLLVFFTGMMRDAGSVLRDQAANTSARLDVLRRMAGAVPMVEQALLSGDVHALGELLGEAWSWKRSLSGLISTSVIDGLYEAGRRAGAWGGKLLGAGGGGCMLFVAPPERHEEIRSAADAFAGEAGLPEFREVPIALASPGCQIVFNGSPDQ